MRVRVAWTASTFFTLGCMHAFCFTTALRIEQTPAHVYSLFAPRMVSGLGCGGNITAACMQVRHVRVLLVDGLHVTEALGTLDTHNCLEHGHVQCRTHPNSNSPSDRQNNRAHPQCGTALISCQHPRQVAAVAVSESACGPRRAGADAKRGGCWSRMQGCLATPAAAVHTGQVNERNIVVTSSPCLCCCCRRLCCCCCRLPHK